MPALSNNSHELFHSNLWAWLINADNNFVRSFFDNFDVSKFNKVYREKNNTDLLILDTDGNHYIIENKFKAVPNEKQLIKYKSKFDKGTDRKNKYLLTSLTDNKIRAKGWKTLSYKEVIERLKKQIKNSKNRIIIKYKSLLEEYCEYVESIINTVYNKDFIKNETYFCGKAISSKINIDDPMKAIYLKLKGEDLRRYIDKKLNAIVQRFYKKGYALKSDLAYNHGKATLTYYIQQDKLDQPNKHASIEIQIEGSQYRYMARTRGSNEKKVEKYVFECFRGTNYFNEEYDKKTNNIVHNRKSSMTCKKGRKSCGYKSKTHNTVAIYQYYNLKHETKYSEIFGNIKTDLQMIYKMLSRSKIKKFLSK